MSRMKTDLKYLSYKDGFRWYVLHDGRKRRTPFSEETERLDAEAWQRQYENTFDKKPRSIAAVPIKTIADWALIVDPADPSSGAFLREKRALKAIVATLGSLPIGQFTNAKKEEFYETRRQQFSKDRRCRDKPTTVKLMTAKASAQALMKVARAYAKVHGPLGVPDTVIGHPPAHQNERVITKSELARILWACLGYQWDPILQAMSRIVSNKLRKSRRRRFRAMKRFILLMAYTGSECGLLYRLSWTPSPNETRSYVDLRKEQNWLHRLGKDEARAEKLKGVPVKLCERIQAHLRRWERLDGGAFEQIVRQGNGPTEYHRRFHEICVAAGLPDVTMTILAKTFGAWGLREGGRIRSLAISVGKSSASTYEKYKTYTKTYQLAAKIAATKRPATIQ